MGWRRRGNAWRFRRNRPILLREEAVDVVLLAEEHEHIVGFKGVVRRRHPDEFDLAAAAYDGGFGERSPYIVMGRWFGYGAGLRSIARGQSSVRNGSAGRPAAL